MMIDPMAHPVPRIVRIFALIYAMFLLGLAVAHGQTRSNPYTDPEGFMANPPATSGPTFWVNRTSPTGPDCVRPYAAIALWVCPEIAPEQTTPSPDTTLDSTTRQWLPAEDGWTPVSATGNLNGVYGQNTLSNLPQPSSRTLMFGNVVTGRDHETQDYAPFLNLANGWQPQAFLVTIVSGDAQWQQVYDVPAWRHRSINLRDVPILKDKVTGFGVFVQAWGVATATVSLHRASDPWGPAYQTIQPDAMVTPSVTAPER